MQDHAGGYKTLNSGISSRNNVQNSDRKNKGVYEIETKYSNISYT